MYTNRATYLTVLPDKFERDLRAIRVTSCLQQTKLLHLFECQMNLYFPFKEIHI